MSLNSLFLALGFSLVFLFQGSQAQLSTTFYQYSCPNLYGTVTNVISRARMYDPRILASLTRLHFHDCFVHGCDASVLLDNSPYIQSEKDAKPNKDSLRGFNVVDDIKAAVESACPGVVSCADILTVAAEISVFLAGGPVWQVAFGRKDSTAAYQSEALDKLPSPFDDLNTLKATFSAVGLSETDLVSLSGAHTFGRAQCQFVTDRLYNYQNSGGSDPSLSLWALILFQNQCPKGGSISSLANLDNTSPDTFDYKYYANIKDGKGLLQSDQELLSTSGASTAYLVNTFATNQVQFFQNFAHSMIKMGNINPLTGSNGEIRRNCRKVNGY